MTNSALHQSFCILLFVSMGVGFVVAQDSQRLQLYSPDAERRKAYGAYDPDNGERLLIHPEEVLSDAEVISEESYTTIHWYFPGHRSLVPSSSQYLGSVWEVTNHFDFAQDESSGMEIAISKVELREIIYDDDSHDLIQLRKTPLQRHVNRANNEVKEYPSRERKMLGRITADRLYSSVELDEKVNQGILMQMEAPEYFKYSPSLAILWMEASLKEGSFFRPAREERDEKGRLVAAEVRNPGERRMYLTVEWGEQEGDLHPESATLVEQARGASHPYERIEWRLHRGEEMSE